MRMRTSHGFLASSHRGHRGCLQLRLREATGAVTAAEEVESRPTAATDDGRTRPAAAETSKTRTPIKHVVVIVGENRTFDHVFATYKPKHGQRVDNLLAEGDRQRRRHARAELRARASRRAAVDSPPSTFELSPRIEDALHGAAAGPRRRRRRRRTCRTLADAEAAENGLPPDYIPLLHDGRHGPDERHGRHPPRAERDQRSARARSS